MQRREQYLMGGLLSAVIVWQLGGWLVSLVLSPVEERVSVLAGLKKTINEKSDKKLSLVRAEKLLKDWRLKSLPPDDSGKSSKRAALDSGRSYKTWLTDIAELCEFKSLKVTPGAQNSKDDIYVSVVVNIDAETTYDGLARFLDIFYRTQLMHRISTMSVKTKTPTDESILKVTLDAEGMVLLDAKPRRNLFPQTQLAEGLADDSEIIQVQDPGDFPKTAGFWVRIQREFMKVTAIDDRKWTVERGWEQTIPAAYVMGTDVELVRLDPQAAEKTIDEYREMIASNIFMKPQAALDMKLTGLAEKSVMRGKTLEFSIVASGYDASKGRPVFAIVESSPAGLKLDRFGKITWKPGSEVAAGKYVVKIEARHPSAENGRISASVSINLREKTAAPKLSSERMPTVLLNRKWTYRPKLISSDQNENSVTWSLGEKPPEGMTIDAESGEINWTPGDATPIGEMTIPLVADDGETPPQLTTLALKVDIQDDAAQFTRLTGIFAIGDSKRAFFYDQSTQKRTELREGDAFTISDMKGTIKTIGKKYVVLAMGQAEFQLEIGDSLREAREKK